MKKELEVEMTVNYVPLPPERVAQWWHGWELLLEIIYDALEEEEKEKQKQAVPIISE